MKKKRRPASKRRMSDLGSGGIGGYMGTPSKKQKIIS